MKNKNWTTDKLENLCDIILGRTPSRSKKEFWGKGTDWVSISDMKKRIISSTKEQITDIGAAKSRSRLIQKGTLLMSFKLSIGKLGFAGKDLYTNEAIASLPIKNTEKLDKEYLYYLLQNIPLIGGNQAVMGKTLNKSSLQKLQIPYPKSIDDQKRIAQVLSDCEDLIDKRKKSIALLDELVKSTFLEMFGDPIEMSTKELEKLSSHLCFLTSGSRGWSKYYSDSGAKFLRIQNVGFGILNEKDVQYVSPPESAESKRTKVKEGDLILSITADLGRTAVIPKNYGNAHINQHLALIRLKKSLNPTYAAFYFAMPFGNRLIQKKDKDGVKSGLNFTDIKDLGIYIPPLEKQEEFVRIFNKSEELKTNYQIHLSELQNLYGRLSQDAFKGTLDLSKVIIKENDEVSSAQTTQGVLNETNYKSLFSIRNIDTYLENKIKNNFRDKDFVFDDIKELLIADYSASYSQYDYDKWKNNFFEILRNKNTYLTQFFDKDQGTVKFKISDEVN